jgi:hypothetical protein
MNAVYIRIAVYMLSGVIGMIPAVAVGWVAYDYVDGWIRISLQVEGAVTAAVAAVGLSGGVFAIWGKK